MLKDLNLRAVYDSSEQSLVHDLIVPLLSISKIYLRGVGFFTSSWLKIAAAGLVHLVENGGTGKIVMSPILQESDLKAFQAGEAAKRDELLKQALRETISDLRDSLEHDTLNALAWMIADNLIEFRLAVARDAIGTGDYHDKVGVFVDETGDTVAIHGSFNDSYHGSLNGEAFSVFKSWELGQLPYVKQHKDRLTRLWEEGNSQFTILSLPEAVRKDLIKLRTTPYPPYRISSNPKIAGSGRTLHDFQKLAIEAWQAAGFQGVFEMATGTGKTFTSLSAAHMLLQNHDQLAVVILVPFLHLLDQWKQNCEEFGFDVMLCSGSHAGWETQLHGQTLNFNIRVLKQLCILAVHDTAASSRFLNAIARLPQECTMVIGDEVHALGSGKHRKAMFPNAKYRLGLSATPRRWYDEEGTAELFNYFGKVCFSYSIDDAIGKYLTPYDYYPVLVNFTPAEEEAYEDITKRIRLFGQLIKEGREDKKRLEKLLIDRALIVSRAENKLTRLLGILESDIAQGNGRLTDHTLIYCAPGTHQKVLRAVADLNVRAREFVHQVGLSDRQKVLDDFDQGHLQALVAIKCLDEGVDVPSTRNAFFLASTTNPREFVQRRGRVLRLHPGKNRAVIYDFFVIPPRDHDRNEADSGTSLLRSQLPRFAEFVSAATNRYEARSAFFDILDSYGLLHLMDLKPWDIYRAHCEESKVEEVFDNSNA